MAANFPALVPSAPRLAAGEWRSNLQTSASGGTSIVTTGTLERGRRLPLEFQALTLAEVMQIINHYKAALSTVDTFQFSPTTLAAGYTPAGMGWIYARPPEIDDLYADIHRVSCEFECVPMLETVLGGARMVAAASISGGFIIGAANSPISADMAPVVASIVHGDINILPTATASITPPPFPDIILEAAQAYIYSAGLSDAGSHLFASASMRVGSDFDEFVHATASISGGGIIQNGASVVATASIYAGGIIADIEPDLLLRFDGTVGSTVITDDSVYARAVTNNITGTGPAGKITASPAKFNQSYTCRDPANASNSANLSIVGGSYIEFPEAYTVYVHFRLYSANNISTGEGVILDIGTIGASTTSGIRIRSGTSGQLRIRIKEGSNYDTTITGPSLALNQWHFLVLTRDASNMVTMGLNGSVFHGPVSMTGQHGRHVGSVDGVTAGSSLRGYMDETIIIKGHAAASLAAPTTPWPYL